MCVCPRRYPYRRNRVQKRLSVHAIIRQLAPFVGALKVRLGEQTLIAAVRAVSVLARPGDGILKITQVGDKAAQHVGRTKLKPSAELDELGGDFKA